MMVSTYSDKTMINGWQLHMQWNPAPHAVNKTMRPCEDENPTPHAVEAVVPVKRELDVGCVCEACEHFVE